MNSSRRQSKMVCTDHTLAVGWNFVSVWQVYYCSTDINTLNLLWMVVVLYCYNCLLNLHHMCRLHVSTVHQALDAEESSGTPTNRNVLGKKWFLRINVIGLHAVTLYLHCYLHSRRTINTFHTQVYDILYAVHVSDTSCSELLTLFIKLELSAIVLCQCAWTMICEEDMMIASAVRYSVQVVCQNFNKLFLRTSFIAWKWNQSDSPILSFGCSIFPFDKQNGSLTEHDSVSPFCDSPVQSCSEQRRHIFEDSMSE